MPPVADAVAPAFETPDASLTDHQVAEGIRDRRFASPQKFGSFWLFALRVTGTGAAYRDSIDEWAYRHKDLWLTSEFLERAASVPIIFGHPPGSGLNSDEYRERAIGNAVLAYIEGDEVWCVAKIFDADAALLMQTTHRSTSPGVTPPQGSVATETEDGTRVLAEGAPYVLDHLAVCEAGVWDKSGPADGIRLDSKGDSVTEEEKKALEKERDDAKRRADSMESELAELKKADKARKDAEITEKEAIAAAEKEKVDKAKKDAARKDWETKMDSESEEEYEKRMDTRMDGESDVDFMDRKKDRKAKKDAAAKAEDVDADRGMLLDSKKRVEDLEREIAALKSTTSALSRPQTIDERNEIATARLRADSIYQMLGEVTPPLMPGETPIAYRRRLADGLRKHDERWKAYTLHDSLDPQAFGLIENAIYDAALAAAKNPAVQGMNRLRPIVDESLGRKRITWTGNQDEAWAPFELPAMRFRFVRPDKPLQRASR